jgi:hypothetical protein
MIAPRRGFLFGAGAALLTAPAIVRVAANLMPISAASKYDFVREIHGYDMINDIHRARFDVIVGGRQWGMDLQITHLGYGRPNGVPDKKLHLDRLFSVIERQLDRSIYAAEMVKPRIPAGAPYVA